MKCWVSLTVHIVKDFILHVTGFTAENTQTRSVSDISHTLCIKNFVKYSNDKFARSCNFILDVVTVLLVCVRIAGVN